MNLNLTKNQNKVLEVLFNNPNKSYYLNELGRLINKKPGVFQRDINNLVKIGLLESLIDGNRRFFVLNKKYYLYNELKSIFFKTTGIEGSVREAFSGLNSLDKVFIYGSYAQGTEKSNSDIDLFIVGTIDENIIIDKVSLLEDKFSKEFNYILMTSKEFEEKKKQSSFVKNVLDNKIIEII